MHSSEDTPAPIADEQPAEPVAEATQARITPSNLYSPRHKTAGERADIFAQTIQDQVAAGGQVESKGHFQAVIRAQGPNRGLHLTLSVFTAGMWAVLVWLPLAIRSRKKRRIVSVDEFGQISIRAAEEVAVDTTGVLDAPQLAGTFVSPKGLAKSTTIAAAGGQVGGVFGPLGGVVGGLLADLAQAIFPKRRARNGQKFQAPEATNNGAPSFEVIAYVAVTAQEVAVIGVHTFLMRKPAIGEEILGRVERSAVASAEIDQRRLAPALKIRFADGGWWEFEVPRIHRDTAAQVVHALGGRVG